ncbi:MAG: FlgD immunoglobulin-like domain containing protein [Gemmataceae bacterium]
MLFATLLLTAVLARPELAPAPRPAQEAAQPPKKFEKGGFRKKGFGGERPAESAAPSAPGEAMPGGLVRMRSLGPALTSGRISGFAVDPKDRSKYYVAVASGGVWKTTNAGTTWTPLFDTQGSFSIGYIALDPKNSDVVWVGTGERNNQRSVGYGDGVYKSTDGGRTWTHLGLKASEHIAKIVVHPTESDTVFVASQGPLWSAGGDRGLYKTTDGGKTWSRILETDEHTGVTDFVIDPKNPDVIVAATHQRRRHVFTIIHGGPGSAIHRTEDGGKTWTKITAGLPKDVDLGRIGLASAPSDPKTLYATVEAAKGQGGIHRSTDFGKTWEKRNGFDQQGQYYSHVVVDPVNKDRIYVMGVSIMVSSDGGGSLSGLPSTFKHVDNHDIWVDPKDPKYYLVGCDGGIYESFDRGQNWLFKANLPVTQYYDVGVDQNPASGPFYHIYGGTQDNFTFGGPVRTRSISGIANSDWYVVQGGDGFHVKVSPDDPNIVFAESQYGGLVRFDRRTGGRTDVRPLPPPGTAPLRWNWDSPLMISPHNPKRVYFAAQFLFRSDDRGSSWSMVSPDLTRQIDRDKLPVMDKVWGPDAVFRHGSTSPYGNIVSLAESMKTEDLLYVGTDDGLIQVTEDGGKNWRKVEKFPGVPERTYVSKLVASQHAADTVFAAFDNHKMGDFKPYLLKSTDAGKSWTSIAGDLPERGTVYCLVEDHVNPDLLFCGTEFGLFATWDGGKKWTKLPGLPTIQVKDLAIQKANTDLVIATFGRGFYVLDDYGPLREYTPELKAKAAHLFQPRDAYLYQQSSPLGGFGKGEQGAAYYTADNPTYGVTLQFHVKEAAKSLKQLREEKEKAGKDKEPAAPSAAVLQAEADEEPAVTTVVISNADGAVVRTLSAPTSAGLHRLVWDLRENATGMYAAPGKYTATLGRRVNGKYEKLAQVSFAVKPDPQYPLTAEQYAEMTAFSNQMRKLQRTMTGTMASVTDLLNRLEAVKTAADLLPLSEEPARQKVRGLLAEVKKVQRTLSGARGPAAAGRDEDAQPITLAQRISYAAAGGRGAIGPPTGTQKQAYETAGKLLAADLATLRRILEKDLPELERKIEAAGGPYIPGRLPVWDGK